jgi:hypothetical protein
LLNAAKLIRFIAYDKVSKKQKRIY